MTLAGEATVVRAWTVRGGRYGEREQTALEEGLTILGWENLGDLSAVSSIEDLKQVLYEAYPDAMDRRIDNWSHQLWRFVHSMQTGDLVVMPQKYKPVVAIGRVIGDYSFRAQAPDELRHVRPVEWLNTSVERAAVGGDLRDSIGSFLTVSELSRRDAVDRVASLAATGIDPGYSGYVAPPANPADLKDEVEQAGTRQLSARDLIGLWGWQRRTTDVIELVDLKLAELGLSVEPHFTAVQLDDLVTVSSASATEDDAQEIAIEHPVKWDPAATGSSDDDTNADLTWRIGSLQLPREVVMVRPADALGVALERMIAGEYSQLPVVDEHRRLIGVITWESIAHAQFGTNPKQVGHAMLRSPLTARAVDELFSRIPDIERRGFLVVVDDENVVRSIITATDLAVELQTRMQPFTVLEEVERRLRRAVASLSVDELRSCFKPNDQKAKKINSPQDLTLGNYKHLFAVPEVWKKLAWPFEQDDIVSRLKRVADYRNEIAHWNIDGPDQDSAELRQAKQLLKLLKVIIRDPLWKPAGS